jgi:outer membrane cobalamin receptor
VYSPEYRAGSELMFKYRSAGLSWYYDYTSDRPINDLNSVELEAVHLVNVSAFYTIETAIVNVRLTGSIQNLSDESYQLIYDYPKPGRTWNLGLRLYL